MAQAVFPPPKDCSGAFFHTPAMALTKPLQSLLEGKQLPIAPYAWFSQCKAFSGQLTLLKDQNEQITLVKNNNGEINSAWGITREIMRYLPDSGALR